MTTQKAAGPAVSSGRVDKRRAILDAALQIFARDGYEAARVEEIAKLAQAAKPTVYNHFSDKATLFAEALAHGAAQANEQILDVIGDFPANPDDVRSELERLGHGLLGCLHGGPGAAALRLQISEATRFPDLVTTSRERNRGRTLDALSAKLAQLAAEGRLIIADPALAARHLMALVSDEPLIVSGYGTRAVAPEVADRAVREGVGTFLAAFGAPHR